MRHLAAQHGQRGRGAGVHRGGGPLIIIFSENIHPGDVRGADQRAVRRDAAEVRAGHGQDALDLARERDVGGAAGRRVAPGRAPVVAVVAARRLVAVVQVIAVITACRIYVVGRDDTVYLAVDGGGHDDVAVRTNEVHVGRVAHPRPLLHAVMPAPARDAPSLHEIQVPVVGQNSALAPRLWLRINICHGVTPL